MSGFTVIDNETGNYPNCEQIALTEEWAENLIYCDIDTFAITEDGNLILMDDCGNCSYCPADRFTIVFEKGVNKMPDKKLTDAEIVKALECCKKNSILDEYCDECPNLAMGSRCMDNMVRDALDLINRLQAENERLNRNLDTISRACKQRRDEAVKEFAERLKENAYYNMAGDNIVFSHDVDDLLKELVGDK